MSNHRTFSDDGHGGGGGSGPPSFGTANLPVGPATGGVLNTSARADHQHPTLEVNTIAGLALVSAATMNNGTFVYVGSLKCWFELQISTLAADAITIVAALGKAASRWVRVLSRNIVYEKEAAWFIDPTNGQDEAAGTTSATSLKTLRELSRRLWGSVIAQNVAVSVLGNLAGTDINTWNLTIVPGFLFTVTGSLGATTGFGGAAINNTLFTGTVTAHAAAALVPTADDIQMTDASIPVSFTASGLLASGVIFRRNTGGTVVHWYALKDLGAKTIRITSPNGNTIAATYQTLTNGDGYSAYAMWQMPAQDWGPDAGRVLVEQFYDVGVTAENQGNPMPRRRRLFIGNQATSRGWGFGGLVNCLLDVQGSSFIMNGFQSNGVTGGPIGGGARGNGVGIVNFLRDTVVLGCWISQGCQIAPNDGVLVAFETMFAIHDTTIPMISPVNRARVNYTSPNAGSGLSGKGNTSKILSITQGGSFSWMFSGANPPFIAGVTTDPNPITINAHSYPVAALPTTTNTIVDPGTVWPATPALPVVNGAQVIAIGVTGPAAIVTPGAAAGWETFRNEAGQLCHRPFWI